MDDICSYTGSQNLYKSDVAEWGVIIDDGTVTGQMMEEYWKPMWEASFVETDCEVQSAMDGLNIDREGEVVDLVTHKGKQTLEEVARRD